MAKFTRSRHGSTGKNITDNKGSIKVTVSMVDGNSSRKGNIFRSLTLADTKVSEVFKAVEKALL